MTIHVGTYAISFDDVWFKGLRSKKEFLNYFKKHHKMDPDNKDVEDTLSELWDMYKNEE